MPMTVFRYSSGSTRVRSANASSTLSHFGRKRTGAGVSGSGSGAARDVEQLAAVLVAKAPQRLEPVERALDLRHVHHRPADDVAARRGPERGEIAAKDLGARLERVVRLRLLDRDEAALGTPLPERRLVVVQHVCAHRGRRARRGERRCP